MGPPDSVRSPLEPREVPPGDVRRRWDENAGWWDDTVGEGNPTQRLILGPATERLLGVRPGQRILDLACGNGHFARRMAELGADVVAVDFSERFLERARRRPPPSRGSVEYRRVDLTDPGELRGLSGRPFDAAVATMALMDVSDLGPLFDILPGLLRAGAPFVFSVTHPVFNQTGAVRGHEEYDSDGGVAERFYVRVDRYGRSRPGLGTGIVGQPTGQWYFERSLTELLRPLLSAGFVVDAFEELGCPPGMESKRALSWPKFTEIPPFLILRARTVRPGGE